MFYVLMFYVDEQAVAALPQEEANALVDRHVRYWRTVNETTNVVAARGLAPSATALTVRPLPGGERETTPGPVSPAALNIAGFYLIEAPDIGVAEDIARSYPMPPGLGAMEVRPTLQTWAYSPGRETRASRQTVWELYHNVSEWPSWMDGVDAATMNGPLAAGTTGRLRWCGELEPEFRVTSAHPGRGFAAEFDVEPRVTLRVEVSLESLPDGGTRIIQRVDMPRTAVDKWGDDFSIRFNGWFTASLEALVRRANDLAGASPAWCREHTIEVPMRSDGLWRLCRDASRWPEWDALLAYVEVEGRLRPGASGRATPPGGSPVPLQVPVWEEEAGYTYELALTPQTTLRSTYRLSPRPGDRTHLTHRVELAGPGAAQTGLDRGEELAATTARSLIALTEAALRTEALDPVTG